MAKAGSLNRVRARRGPAVGRARLQCDVKRRSAGIFALSQRILDSFDLRVRVTGAPMPSLANDTPAFNEHGTDHRVGRCFSVATSGQTKSPPHEGEVVGGRSPHHLTRSKVLVYYQ